MAKIRHFWKLLLGAMLSMLGFSGCDPISPDMYGPATTPEMYGPNMMLMYGPKPPTSYTKAPSYEAEPGEDMAEVDAVAQEFETTETE